MFSEVMMRKHDTTGYHVEKDAFELAQQEDTVEAYEKFMDEFPDSEWNRTAICYRDLRICLAVIDARDTEALRQFLVEYPETTCRKRVDFHIENGFD